MASRVTRPVARAAAGFHAEREALQPGGTAALLLWVAVDGPGGSPRPAGAGAGPPAGGAVHGRGRRAEQPEDPGAAAAGHPHGGAPLRPLSLNIRGDWTMSTNATGVRLAHPQHVKKVQFLVPRLFSGGRLYT